MFTKKMYVSICSLLLCTLLMCNTVNAYDGNAAAEYAQKYADSKNSKYDYYVGRDCTNFTSQCLANAAFPTITLPNSVVEYSMLGGTYRSYAYFSHKKYTKSWLFLKKTDFVSTTTWSLAGAEEDSDNCFGFYDYVTYKGLVPITFTTTQLDSLATACSVGDIIQLRHKGSDSTADHTFIVTKKTYNSVSKKYDICVCAHSTNRKNADFRTLVENKNIKSTDTLILLRITKADLNSMAQKKVYK